MQTFLPYPSFSRSASVLDDRRLGKQRVEALQILRALHLQDYGWANHPAVLMWRGRRRALVAYGLAVVAEWCRRGHADGTRDNIAEFARPDPVLAEAELSEGEMPPWLGWPALHRSHRASLLRKDPATYAAAFPDTPSDLPYVWPEPPAGPPATEPVDAWAVRGTSSDALAAFRADGFVGLPLSLGGPRTTPKKRRQLDRLSEVAAIGERVVLPEGGDVLAGVITGPPTERDVAGATYVTRQVAWQKAVSRSHLLRPYQLQDPQLMFAIRGEPALRS